MQVKDDGKPVRYLNELEWVKGEVWGQCVANRVLGAHQPQDRSREVRRQLPWQQWSFLIPTSEGRLHLPLMQSSWTSTDLLDQVAASVVQGSWYAGDGCCYMACCTSCGGGTCLKPSPWMS